MQSMGSSRTQGVAAAPAKAPFEDTPGVCIMRDRLSITITFNNFTTKSLVNYNYFQSFHHQFSDMKSLKWINQCLRHLQ